MHNHGVNKDILMEYLKINPPFNFNGNFKGIENLSVVEMDSIYFKIKLDGYTTSLYNINYKTYKLFERNFKLKKLLNNK